MVHCPLDARPGQKIRFQLPIQLSEAQLQTYNIHYSGKVCRRRHLGLRLGALRWADGVRDIFLGTRAGEVMWWRGFDGVRAIDYTNPIEE